jgi:hypothetical protein
VVATHQTPTATPDTDEDDDSSAAAPVEVAPLRPTNSTKAKAKKKKKKKQAAALEDAVNAAKADDEDIDALLQELNIQQVVTHLLSPWLHPRHLNVLM